MKISLKYYPQYENYSCGPVSLRMVFEHLGKHYSEEKMIKLCHAMPKVGTSHKHMIEEVNNEGFKYITKDHAGKQDLLNFLEDGYPVIVNYFNPLSKGGHYAVIVGHDDDYLIFADPANGNDFTLKWDEFHKLWHNKSNTSKGWLLVIGRDKIIL